MNYKNAYDRGCGKLDIVISLTAVTVKKKEKSNRKMSSTPTKNDKYGK
jgi:hypothetical protein